tara:strand:- start:11158 stop:11454 length:297 start_codon:yes stop_codon:yes gene_type:complete
MLEQTDRERLAVVENDAKWVRESLDRLWTSYTDGLAALELSQKELVKSLDKHLTHHRRGNGNGGINLSIGRGTAAVLISTIFGTGGLLWVLLGLPGVT